MTAFSAVSVVSSRGAGVRQKEKPKAGHMSDRDTQGIGIVFGGGNGIGAACCRLMRERGWQVVVADFDVDTELMSGDDGGVGESADGDVVLVPVRRPEPRPARRRTSSRSSSARTPTSPR